jgi:hypothetical protein
MRYQCITLWIDPSADPIAKAAAREAEEPIYHSV